MNKRTMTAAVALVAAVALLLCAWYFTRPPAQEGEKAITVLVVHRDETRKSFPVSTDAEYLGEALVEAGIVEDNQTAFGLYILTADGETADEGAQEWWCVTKGGEQLTTGASETPLSDGDAFELTFTTGYDA